MTSSGRQHLKEEMCGTSEDGHATMGQVLPAVIHGAHCAQTRRGAERGPAPRAARRGALGLYPSSESTPVSGPCWSAGPPRQAPRMGRSPDGRRPVPQAEVQGQELPSWLLRRRLSLERRWRLLGARTRPLICVCTSPRVRPPRSRGRQAGRWRCRASSLHTPSHPGHGDHSFHTWTLAGTQLGPGGAPGIPHCGPVTPPPAPPRTLPQPGRSPRGRLPSPLVCGPLSSLNLGGLCSWVDLPSAPPHPAKRPQRHEGLRLPREVEAAGPACRSGARRFCFQPFPASSPDTRFHSDGAAFTPPEHTGLPDTHCLASPAPGPPVPSPRPVLSRRTRLGPRTRPPALPRAWASLTTAVATAVLAVELGDRRRRARASPPPPSFTPVIIPPLAGVKKEPRRVGYLKAPRLKRGRAHPTRPDPGPPALTSLSAGARRGPSVSVRTLSRPRHLSGALAGVVTAV